ncbi:hypothetical protein GCM10017673_58380 [Streptosporangium violaceochromogenes]|nr:hypothetical protein GCM10017673_58380 [Streptosporangium violaceochromogenes]
MTFPGPGPGDGGGRGSATGRNTTKGGSGSATNKRHPATPTHQGAAPMAFGLITHVTELPTIAAGYESDDMMDVKGHLEMLHELPLQAAGAIRVLTERLVADYPIDH